MSQVLRVCHSCTEAEQQDGKRKQAKPLFPASFHTVSFFEHSNIGFKFFTVKPFLMRNDQKGISSSGSSLLRCTATVAPGNAFFTASVIRPACEASMTRAISAKL